MMYNVFNADCDSSSRCSTASPAGDSFGYNPSPAGSYTSMGSPHSQDFSDLTVSSASPFVPTVTAISSSPDLQWMVQPLNSSVAPPRRAHPYTPGPGSAYPQPTMKAQAAKAHGPTKRDRAQQVCSEEDEKRRVRRERNKQAAAKCRNRRRELTDTLQAETDDLEDEKSNLQNDIANLLKEKERLEFILASHRPICKIPSELDAMFAAASPASPALSHSSTELSPNTTSSVCSTSSTAGQSVFSSASHSLFSSPAPVLSAVALGRVAAPLTMLDDALEESLDLLARTELEAARSVPDVDLSSSLYTAAQDWEPLYTSARITSDNNNNNNNSSSSNNNNNSISMDFEPLCTPVVTCTPSCTTFTSSFVFTYPEAEAFPTCGLAHRRGSNSNEYSSDSLSSPTLLAL